MQTTKQTQSGFRPQGDRAVTLHPTTSRFHPQYDSTLRTLSTTPEQHFQPRPSTSARKQAEKVAFRSFLNKSTIYSQFLKNRKKSARESKRAFALTAILPPRANKRFESFPSNFRAESVAKSLDERIQSFKDNIALSLATANDVDDKSPSSGKRTINSHSTFQPKTSFTGVEESDIATVTELESTPCWKRDNATLNILPARNISNMANDLNIPSMHISNIQSLQKVGSDEQDGPQNTEEENGCGPHETVAGPYRLKNNARMRYFKVLMHSRLEGGESISDLAKDDVFDELLEICDGADIFPANQKGDFPSLERYRTLRKCLYLRLTKRNVISLKEVILKALNDNLG